METTQNTEAPIAEAPTEPTPAVLNSLAQPRMYYTEMPSAPEITAGNDGQNYNAFPLLPQYDYVAKPNEPVVQYNEPVPWWASVGAGMHETIAAQLYDAFEAPVFEPVPYYDPKPNLKDMMDRGVVSVTEQQQEYLLESGSREELDYRLTKLEEKRLNQQMMGANVTGAIVGSMADVDLPAMFLGGSLIKAGKATKMQGALTDAALGTTLGLGGQAATNALGGFQSSEEMLMRAVWNAAGGMFTALTPYPKALDEAADLTPRGPTPIPTQYLLDPDPKAAAVERAAMGEPVDLMDFIARGGRDVEVEAKLATPAKAPARALDDAQDVPATLVPPSPEKAMMEPVGPLRGIAEAATTTTATTPSAARQTIAPKADVVDVKVAPGARLAGAQAKAVAIKEAEINKLKVKAATLPRNTVKAVREELQAKIDTLSKEVDALKAGPTEPSIPTVPTTLDERISGTRLGATPSINRTIRNSYKEGDFMGLLQTLKKESPSAAYTQIVDRVIAKADKMIKSGVRVELGHSVSPNARGTVRNYPSRGAIPETWEVGLHDVAGMNTVTALHEAIHVVTINALTTNKVLRKEAVELLEVVRRNAEKFHNSPQMKNYTGEVPKVISESHLRSNNSLENIKELVAWGMSNPEFQRFLASIPYKKGNAWDAFVMLVKKSLGLTKNDTALDEVLRIFNVATDGATEAPKLIP